MTAFDAFGGFCILVLLAGWGAVRFAHRNIQNARNVTPAISQAELAANAKRARALILGH